MRRSITLVMLLVTLAACTAPRQVALPVATAVATAVPTDRVFVVDSAESQPLSTAIPTTGPPPSPTSVPTAPPTATNTPTPAATVAPTATATPTALATVPPDTQTGATAAPPTVAATVVATVAATAVATSVPPTAAPAGDAPPANISPPTVGPAAPSAYETSVTIPTYDYAAGFVDTAPDDAVYPYPRLDFGRVGGPTARTYRAIVLENGYVSVTILPELGGRVYRWVDKATGRELLYQNSVIKPTSWGYRGWWLAAGGIEWAFPVEEHGLNEWRPWEYAIGYSDYGLAVFVSNVDDRTGMEVGASISLDTDHAYVTLQPWARNDTAEAHPYQLWLNAMVAINGNYVSGPTQFIVPSSQVIVHSTGDGALPGPGGSMGWPSAGGRDMSWYSSWSAYLGFFIPTGSADYVGIYDHSLDQGVVRVLPSHGWPSGTKIFGPATLSPSLWTDDSSNYVELWSGATPSFNSYWTLEPGQSVGWTEHWYPVNGLAGFTYANQSAALRLVNSGGAADVGVAVTRAVNGSLTLFAGGAPVATWPVSLVPGQAWRSTWVNSAETAPLGLRLTANSGTILAQTGTVP